MADELSFQDRLETILDEEDSYLEEAREAEKENREGDGFVTCSDFSGTPDDPHQIPLRLRQSDPHRPEVDTETVRRLHLVVKREKSSVPAKKMDFNTNLEILLDAAERYYEAVQCEIVKKSTLVSGGK